MVGFLKRDWPVMGGGLAFLALAVYAIWIVKRQYRERGQLSDGVVVEVWAMYLLHAFLVGIAAWFSVWPVPINQDVTAVIGVLLLAVLFAVVVHVYITQVEEGYLERLYGESYREYRADTRAISGFRRMLVKGAALDR